MPMQSTLGSKPSKAGIGCLIFFALFWSGITLTFDFLIGRNAVRQMLASNYASTAGVITQSEIEGHPGRHGSTYGAKIGYRYQVAGKTLIGNQYRYGAISSSDSNAAKTVAAFPVGKKVTVYYSPDNPADAVLLPGLEGMDLFLALFISPFNIVMLGIWLSAFSPLGRRGKQAFAGGAKIQDDGFRTQVRLTQFTPLGAELLFNFLATFAAILVVIVFSSSSPLLNLMLCVWAALMGGTVLVFLWTTVRLASGDWDLVIDDTDRSVTLPRTFGRTTQVVVPAKKIQAIEVERIASKGHRGSNVYQYVPTLVYSDQDNAPARAKLAHWSNGPATEALAAWLREKLQLKPSATEI